MTTGGFESIDDYIAAQPKAVQSLLQQMRATVAREAPDAVEKISYQMPTFYLNGNLVHFAAFRNHIGFYPTSSGVAAFEKELSGYQHARGSIRFPKDQPLPLALIRKIVQHRVRENSTKG